MKTWHAFALSSLWEGLPCAIIEARLSHLPVISYDTGGIHEIIINNENGLLLQKGNWKELALGMKRIMHEHNLYRKFQRYTDNLNDFDTTHMIQEHIQLYRQLSR